MPETTYIVLRRVVAKESLDGTFWEEIDSGVPATSAEGAVRATAAALTPAAGTYVAAPMRSWKPVQVSAVQTTVLKLDPT